jgi:hypothetical protein
MVPVASAMPTIALAPRARFAAPSRWFRLGLVLLGASGGWACGSDGDSAGSCPNADCPAREAGGSAGTGAAPSSDGRSGACRSDASCDGPHGFACVAGECRHPCASHFDCQGAGLCQPLTGANGEALGNYCALFDTAEPPGQYYTRCPTYTECDGANGFSCLGAGVGDADAYCSSACAVDTDCPAGFYCDAVADQTTGAEQRQCVRRRFCAPCETDADCLTVPGQLCARDPSGEKVCTEQCDPSVDSCPWGNAAVCGVFDQELGVPTCAHRFGSCHGEGKSCEPCVRDADCPRGICSGSSYTGERWCIDDAVACDCAGLATQQHICEDGNGCPRTPGGLEMSCYDFSRGTGDPLAHACFTANTTGTSELASPQAGCWGPL